MGRLAIGRPQIMLDVQHIARGTRLHAPSQRTRNMTKLTDELAIDLPLDAASLACRSAIATVGWNIKSVRPHRIVPKIGVGLTRWPSKIEVLLAQADESRTTVTLNGSIGGYGPIQKNHLKGEMNRLRNAIEVAAAQTPRTEVLTNDGANHGEPVEQLRKLGELRDAGVLTDAEFENTRRPTCLVASDW